MSLLDLASRDEWTITRIARLLAESYRRARESAEQEIKLLTGDEYDEFESGWPVLENKDFYEPARNALKTNIGIHWNEFRMDFANVVKMDYLLYTTEKISKVNWRKYKSKEKLADIIVKVITKVVDQFTYLI